MHKIDWYDRNFYIIYIIYIFTKSRDLKIYNEETKFNKKHLSSKRINDKSILYVLWIQKYILYTHSIAIEMII